MQSREWRHNPVYLVYVFGLVCLIVGEVFASNSGSSGFGPAIGLIGAGGFFLSIAHPIIASAEYAKRFPSLADQLESKTLVRERLVLSPRVNQLPPRVVLVA